MSRKAATIAPQLVLALNDARPLGGGGDVERVGRRHAGIFEDGETQRSRLTVGHRARVRSAADVLGIEDGERDGVERDVELNGLPVLIAPGVGDGGCNKNVRGCYRMAVLDRGISVVPFH